MDSIRHAESLAGTSSAAVLRALSSARFRDDPRNAAVMELLAEAEAEMDRAGRIGLTVSFDEVRLLAHAEGIWGDWFGARGEYYVLATALDGSGRPFEYRTHLFPGIGRNEPLPLGDGGLLVTWLENPRWFVDVHMLVMESDSDSRELGRLVEEARRETGLDDVLRAAAGVGDFDPELVARVIGGVDLFLGALVWLLKSNGDDHVATIHDFYLKHQAFGKGRHPAEGRQRFQGVEAAYEIRLSRLEDGGGI